jgi:acyl-CoA synthetase (AMP-forming)/AMP-acid ligase II
MSSHPPHPGHIGLSEDLAGQAAALTLGDLFAASAHRHPRAVAVSMGARRITFAELERRVNRLANALAAQGIGRGERVGLLSENRPEYLELTLACARLGAILCALNWRLTPHELQHCVGLTTPALVVTSPRYRDKLEAIAHGARQVLELGEPYEALLARAAESAPAPAAQPEDGLLILYTSGTTGLPKGALISHRAEIARMQVNVLDMGLRSGAGFTAWPPMYHMASLEQALHVLAVGGTVHVFDGLEPDALVRVAAAERLWWLVLMPGMVDQMIEALQRASAPPQPPEQCGAMADLVPAHQIAEVTRLLGAPYVNTFGATETGIPPLSAHRIEPGKVPERLSKRPNSLCRLRLVDGDDRDVPDGAPGELAFRGPTCFSGYWNAAETNARDFRGGWFHLGDMFVRREDGSYDFVDRVKYLIKSGGENVYPAEIERVLLRDPRVAEAVVVRRKDAKWGEVPVAFVARSDESLSAEALAEACRGELAGYKQPREIRFVPFADFPRSTTGKVQRHEVEKWLER